MDLTSRPSKLGEFHQRGVTALAHGLDDVEHALVDRVVGHTFPAQQMIQMMGEIRVSGVESGNCSGAVIASLIGLAKTQAP
jgi:hypothetical protein